MRRLPSHFEAHCASNKSAEIRVICGRLLLDEPDRHRVTIEFSVARLDGGDDAEDGVQDPEDGEKNKADQHQAKNRGNAVVDEHRDLEVDRFLAVRVELGRFVALQEPDEKRREQVAGEMNEDAEQSAGVTKGSDAAHVRTGWDADGQWRRR